MRICEEFGVDEKEMFRISEAFGFGMGMMEMCGVVSGMLMVIGLQNSVGSLENSKPSKADTYKKAKEFALKFKEKHGSYICRELKGVGYDRPLCSCDQCVAGAAELVEQYLTEYKE